MDQQRLKIPYNCPFIFVITQRVVQRKTSISIFTNTSALYIYVYTHYSTLAKVKLGAPELYISCTSDDKQLIDKALLDEYDKFYCLDESATDFVEQTESEKCNWQRLHIELITDKPLIAEIPVGDANGYIPVLCATLIISWGATIWIMLTTRKASIRINKQLAEEELQEEKLE